MDDFTAEIIADPEYAGGEPWRESECLGGEAIVKVRASAALLATINAEPGFQRIPARFTDLSTPLGDLTVAERTALNNKLVSLGYEQAEIDAALGATNGAWRTKTLGQVFRFALSRRQKPRYDQATDAIVLDGPDQPCAPIDDVDAAVR